jgi:hypothetical protein
MEHLKVQQNLAQQQPPSRTSPLPSKLQKQRSNHTLSLTSPPTPLQKIWRGEKSTSFAFQVLRPERVSGKIGVNNLPYPLTSNGEGEIPSSKSPSPNFLEREIAERSSDEGEVNTLGFPETL